MTTEANTTIWLSGASNVHLKAAVAEGLPVGLLAQPGNSYELQIDAYPAWAADNGAFKKGATFDRFDFVRFDDYLDRRLARLTDAQKARCRFVNAPDAIDVSADGRTVTSYPQVTIERFRKYAPRIKALGLPVALVGQPGMELMIDELPWDELDVLFLGGDNAWKLGEGARILTEAARARGKTVHMGRVNSRKRLCYAASIGCSSADGTFLAIARGQAGVDRVIRWFAPGLPSHPPVPSAPAIEIPVPVRPAAAPKPIRRCPECGRPTTQPDLCRDCIDRLAREGSELDRWVQRRAA